MAAARLTILCILRRAILRADFDSTEGNEPTAVHAAEAEEGEGLGTLVARAAELGGPLRGPVWVLAEEMLTQSMDFAAGALKNASDQETERALRYEAQLSWGLDSTTSVIGWTRAKSPRGAWELWITATTISARDDVSAAVRRLGGRFVGMAHPAAVPRAIALDAPREWLRAESWTELQAEVGVDADGDLIVHIGGAEPSRSRRSAGATESLIASRGSVSNPGAAGTASTLEDPQMRSRWLAAWGTVLLRPKADFAFPWISSPLRRVSRAVTIGIGAAAAVAVAGLCWADFYIIQSKVAQVSRELDSASAPAARLAQIEDETRKIEIATSQMQQQLEARDPQILRSKWTSSLTSAILEVTARATPPDVALRELSLAAESSWIRGVCLSVSSPGVLALEISKETEARGYRACATRKVLRKADPGERASYDFEVAIIPIQAGTSQSTRVGEER